MGRRKAIMKKKANVSHLLSSGGSRGVGDLGSQDPFKLRVQCIGISETLYFQHFTVVQATGPSSMHLCKYKSANIRFSIENSWTTPVKHPET
jgi:hypothetical protein